MRNTVLVADDSRDIVAMIASELERENFDVLRAYDGKQALKIMADEPVDFLILDIMMPEMDGLEVCRRLGNERNIPVLLLSARDREIDRIIGLEVGADDYMTKPFSLNELVARVKAHFRKMSRLEEHLLKRLHHNAAVQETLTLNERTYEAVLNGRKLDLSAKEFQLLAYFLRNANRILSREQIYDHVWGNDDGDINTVTVHIKNLRKKFGPDNAMIRTVWGVGYCFDQKAVSG